MSPFRAGSLRTVVVGAGAMGTEWLRAIDASPDVELAAVVDLDASAAARAARGAPSATTLDEVAADADFVVDATVPAAHFAVTASALRLGLPVLGEKPLAETLPQALTLAALSSLTGAPFAVSQSRRFEPHLTAFKSSLGSLGPVGSLTTEFYRGPRFGGFRETMAHPLLLDMAIHAFDTARYLLDDEPVSVYCDAYNPAWSWYAGDASVNALFRFASGARYSYLASWCATGRDTSWNGSWRAVAERGTVLWDGDHDPASGSGAPNTLLASISGSLAAFVDALRAGRRPATDVHRNVMSLAMVLCAVESADTGAPVRLDESLARAHAAAVQAAAPDVGDVLRSWPSVREALARG
ncbi:Gfo/Idh/MocA family oxidoreductase [Plantactinospora sp. S1510]|uniref:Gfo/Idh/MocA family oxidoreductase n=1 Tax=Plantactinospora alkalitolerans TaxID=2789879 RepID=A0ABS0GQ69_9ACTN|nr:Gfo/Idh/MocA family oxidoreductase [Plantactinospora alkalitolerans]MBF9128347.1 Gfo/Idh/MocA family oxidoreductase [Plantactinospora alkalitolerans]